jgi:hypothetical protein
MNPACARVPILVEAEALTWMAVHGNLCLSLRHPQNQGPSRALIADVIRDIGDALVNSGLLTRAEIDQAQVTEGL